MRIWTTHPIVFWNHLKEQGVIHCDTQKSFHAEEFRGAYDWMASQMVKRIGPPPVPEVKYPIWGYQQVGSHKKEYHGSLFDCKGEDNEFVFITAEVPDDQVLLSDYDLWHVVLTHYLNRHDDINFDYIFDLNRRGKFISFRRNRWIQATFWELKREWVVDAKRINIHKQQQFERYMRMTD